MSEPGTSGCWQWLAAAVLLPFFLGFVLFTGITIEEAPLPTAAAPAATPESTGGLRLVLEPAAAVDDATMQAITATLTQRLVAAGLAAESVTIQISGTQFVVDLQPAPLLDTNELIATLTEVGLLEFVDFSGMEIGEIEQLIASGMPIATTQQATMAIIPDGAYMHPLTGQPFVTVLTGAAVQQVTVVEDSFVAGWLIQLELQAEFVPIFAAFTDAHIGQPLAILLDGRLLSAPTIQTKLEQSVLITGNFTEAEARQLEAQLISGTLPVRLTLVSIDIIQP